jgi:NAD(P)-dependent dehydrogenase (short-subunit alcohol dehydrogenase family)
VTKQQCVIVSGSSGHIGSNLVNRLLAKSEITVIGIDIWSNGLDSRKFMEFEGSVLDLKFLNRVSCWIRDSGYELVGIVTCMARKEFNNSADEYSIKLKDKFPHLPSKTLNLLAAWAEYPQEEATKAFEVNCLGANNVVASQVENLLKAKSASVVHISSQYGLKPPRQELFESLEKFSYKPYAYSISKAALTMLSEYQASIFAGTCVRVNTISPGSVFQNQSEEFQEKYAAQTWSKSMLYVEDIVKPIEFLLSDASNYINGANLIVDGGWSRA